MSQISDPTDRSRRLLCSGGLAFAAVQLTGCDVGPWASAEDQSMRRSNLPALSGATGWLNSPPLTSDGLKGKVVLADFWTYTCINWIRTLPYVRAWAEKYREHGLVVIGIHTPEFEFEKNVDNVRTAAKAMRVDYPIALDPDYSVWEAFSNHYWPAVYIADATGRIRHHQFGEGGYEDAERVIQQLLAEAGQLGVPGGLVSGQAEGVEVAADWDTLRSGETYVGYAQGTGFVSPETLATDQPRAYSAPTHLNLNTWALSGTWTVAASGIRSDAAGGRLSYRFQARDLHLVLGPSHKGATVRFRVTLDGQAPGDAHGVDIDAQGNGTVIQQRLYQLVRQPGVVSDRQFEVEFLDPGADVYVFTFG
ncbi:redoxin domain-containing protein [Devosia insulae]|nr:redoxin family protein [Devosia insulae]